MKPSHAAPLLVLLATLAAGAAFAQQAKSAHLTAVLAAMDDSSAKFQSAQADVRQEVFTKHPIEDTETRIGQIYFERKNATTQMGMRLLPPDAKPGTPPAQIVEFKDGKLRVLDTGSNQVDQFLAGGKNQGLAETALTLGFGGSGRALAKAFTITDQGTEQMSDGSKSVSVEKLDLVATDPAITKNYSHITIWVDPARDVSLKQILFEATTGGTKTMIYTNIRLNEKVNESPFSTACKGKCTTVNH
jgi:outer membrane lipoprotein-sorting protein